MKLLRVLIAVFFLTSAAGAPSQNRIYRNREFGIVLPIPFGSLPCVPPFYRGTGVNHGLQILLGTNDASVCSKSSGKRYVDVWGSFTVTEDESTLRGLIDSDCTELPQIENDPGAICTAAPADLSFNRLPSASTRIDHSNGWVEIIVVTLAGKPNPVFDPPAPTMNYELRLYTDAKHLDEDLAVLRVMLKTIKLTAPIPPKSD